MIKKFAISLIILSSLVYGGMFLMAKQHGTGFFDEMLIQMNRMATSMGHRDEVTQSKLILATILKNEHPPANWDRIIEHNQQNDHNELFYYYKIWTIKTGLQMEEIKGSYPIFKSSKNNVIFINMRYGKKKAILQFPFTRDNNGNLITGLFFPINERPLSADFNNDNTINHEDVDLARKSNKKAT